MNLKVKVAADAERRESIGASLRRIEDARREVDERRARLFAALSEANARAAELRGRVEGTQPRPRPARRRTSRRCARSCRRARAAHEAAWPRLPRAATPRCASVRSRAEGVRSRRREAALTAREQALALSHLEEQTRERCQAELKWEVARFHLERPPGEAERERLEELKGAGGADGRHQPHRHRGVRRALAAPHLHERAEGGPGALARRPEVRHRQDQPGLAASASRRPSTA